VGRIERDKDKVKALYDQGYAEAESCYEELMQYLKK
jgi:predicted patatin/cPLA2 family phospholipase